MPSKPVSGCSLTRKERSTASGTCVASSAAYISVDTPARGGGLRPSPPSPPSRLAPTSSPSRAPPSMARSLSTPPPNTCVFTSATRSAGELEESEARERVEGDAGVDTSDPTRARVRNRRKGRRCPCLCGLQWPRMNILNPSRAIPLLHLFLRVLSASDGKGVSYNTPEKHPKPVESR
eukprot:2134301-Pyramimonas_sp.AAC.2